MDTLLSVLRSRVGRACKTDDAPALPTADDALPCWLRDLVAQEQAAAELRAGRPQGSLSVAEGLPELRSHRTTVLLARAGLASGDQTAATLMDPAAIERSDSVPVDVQVDAWLVKAQARLVAGDHDQAVTALRRGIRLARPESLRRPFRDAAREVRRMLRNEASLAPAATWLSRSPGMPAPTKLMPLAPGRNGAPAPIIVDALSARETEVLRHLAELLTTEEVAVAMFVSVNTVKSHIRSILRKLSVSRRNEAIRRARELQLI
jgi:LuxR family transcriptional regulator, maltose regulon positive regulatory protein